MGEVESIQQIHPKDNEQVLISCCNRDYCFNVYFPKVLSPAEEVQDVKNLIKAFANLLLAKDEADKRLYQVLHDIVVRTNDASTKQKQLKKKVLGQLLKDQPFKLKKVKRPTRPVAKRKSVKPAK